jgi:hypothetical protein
MKGVSQMAIYLANVNGDWWATNAEQPLFVLDTDKLSPEMISRIEDYTGLDFADVVEQDKFEEIIVEFGTKFFLGLVK